MTFMRMRDSPAIADVAGAKRKKKKAKQESVNQQEKRSKKPVNPLVQFGSHMDDVVGDVTINKMERNK